MKFEELTLPHIAYFDGQSHEGNSLEGRELLMHFPTHTIFEIICTDTVIMSDITVPHTGFSRVNYVGFHENYIIAHYRSEAEGDELKKVYEEVIKWYCQNADWEEQALKEDGDAAMN